MKIKLTPLVAGGLAISLATSLHHDAIPEGHVEVSVPTEAIVICAAAPYTSNVTAGVWSGSFNPGN